MIASTVASGRNLTTSEKLVEASKLKELLDQEIVAPGAESKADGAAAKREQQPFAKQLPNDLPARCTDGESNRDLFRARGPAGEQHVGEV